MEDEDKSIHSPFFDREIYKKQIEKIVDVMDRAHQTMISLHRIRRKIFEH